MKCGKYTLIIAPKNYPGKKYRDRYAYEHIVVFWRRMKRLPKLGCEIHHIDGDHRNNKFKNLMEIPALEHRRLHAELRRVPNEKFNCDNCEKPHEMIAAHYQHKLRQGQKFFFCSQKCAADLQHSFGGTLR